MTASSQGRRHGCSCAPPAAASVGLNFGLTEVELNDDENLTALCAECNLGMGAEPISLRLAVNILRARMSWAKERS